MPFLRHLRRIGHGLLLTSLGVPWRFSRSDWAIDMQDGLALREAALSYLQTGTLRVAEFGGGASTLLFARLRREFRQFSLVTFEADAATAARLAAATAAAGDRVRIVHTPYVEEPGYRGFDRTIVEANLARGSVDLVFVDAPPDTLHLDARAQACELALPYLAPRGSLLLHDTHRMAERFAAEALSARFTSTRRVETRRGLTVFHFPREAR